MTKFLNLLDRLLGDVVIAIQANPDISSIAVGGVKLIVDIAIGFTKFFSKLMEMLDRLSEMMAPLERYAERLDLCNIENALVDIYGDILEFCRAASAVLLDKNGKPKEFAMIKLLFHLQWEPFETTFDEIAVQMERHCQVILQAAQAELLAAEKNAEQREKGRFLSETVAKS